MRISMSIERLRIWLLVGAGLLVLVIVSFLGYAHYRTHRFLSDLPEKLGVDVARETNAFTYSQSVGGRTIYTIHAARAVQHKNGKYTLHDVGIVVYGHNSDRADRIYGAEFEYDQKDQVARAMGEVHLDLQAPAPTDAQGKREYAAGGEPGGSEPVGADAHMIHVKTSGLVFMQKLGVAATDQPIEFEYGGMTGHAVGADYDSDTGVLVLHSAVQVVGLQQGQPATLTASRAELNRPAKQVVLTQAKYVLVGRAGEEAGETAQARRMVVHLRDDGSAERMEAEGAVTLTDADGGRVVAPRGNVLLNAESRPQSAVLTGGVHYVADEPLRQAQGEAAEGKASFDNAGRLQHITLNGAVKLRERVRASQAANALWSERDLGAGTVELAMVADKAGKARLQEAKAIGDAHLKVVSQSGKPGHVAVTSSDLAGDLLTAHFAAVDGAQRLALVNGAGHTLLRRVSATGAVNTSAGDALEVHFKPEPGHPGAAQEIATAVQEGHVVMTQAPAKAKGPADASPPQQRALAARAVYDGAMQKLTLTGGVQLTQAADTLWADRITVEQRTNDAEADGGVKASYSGNGGEPVHVLAARAVLKHNAGQATFYGGDAPARLWQGASQVEAPVLEFNQKEKRLVARGDGASAAVHTALVSEPRPNSGTAKGAEKAAPAKVEVLRITSRMLTYSDATRQAEFTGGVRVESADGSMRGQQAVVYLQAAKTGATKPKAATASAPAAQAGFFGGGVDRVVASGHIEIDQPGRRATGERVVYTAADGMFVMTGTPASPPKVVDAMRGTVTGASLRFHAGDESVVVSNGVDNRQRVRTETWVKKNR